MVKKGLRHDLGNGFMLKGLYRQCLFKIIPDKIKTGLLEITYWWGEQKMFQKGGVGRTNRPTNPIGQNSPNFCTVLSGNGNRFNTRWRPNKKEKEPRSPRSHTRTELLTLVSTPQTSRWTLRQNRKKRWVIRKKIVPSNA